MSVCHCTECQRRTGSVFATQARFRRAQAKFEGAPARFRRVGDGGTTAEFAFCPICGSTVWWESDADPEVVAIAVGAFADPSFPAPAVSVYEERRHDWVGLPEGWEHIR